MSTLLEEDLAPFGAVEAHWSTGTIMAVFLAASMIAAVVAGLGYSFGLGATADRLISMAMSRPVNAAEWIVQSAKAVSLRDGHKPGAVEKAGEAATATSRSDVAVAHRKAIAAASMRHHTVETSSRYMVQIGAIANRRDARRLTSQLRRRGFHAAIYPGRHDRYLHVQIGPFAQIEQAQAVRQHVLASGFHATLRHAS